MTVIERPGHERLDDSRQPSSGSPWPAGMGPGADLSELDEPSRSPCGRFHSPKLGEEMTDEKKDFDVQELDDELDDVSGGSCAGCNSCSGCAGTGCAGCGTPPPLEQQA